jgi:nitrogen fixation NifU-like protein
MPYSEKVMEHFQNPHNQGQISNASAIGEVGNPLCGDIMKIYLKISKVDSADRLQDIISDVKFETLGCAAAIACSSASTDMVKGKTLKEAYNLEKKDIVNELGELPPVKLHCSVLASDGLKVAIRDYLKKLGVLDEYPEIRDYQVENHLH